MHVDWLLILKYFQGGCSKEELLVLENWRTSDPSHQKFFDELAEIWQKTGSLYSEYEPDKSAAWKKVVAKSLIKEKDDVFGIKNIKIFIRWAAVIFLLITIPIVLYFLNPNKHEVNSSFVYKTGKSKTLYVLPDSSSVILNKNAKLIFNSKPGKNNRIVNLDGSAYFKVKTDKQHPFVVYTHNTGAEVVGTTFYMDCDTVSQKNVLIVTSGKVKFFRINKPDTFIIVSKNEKAIFDISKDKMYKEVFNNPNEIAWQSGNFIFDKTRLDSICIMLSNFYDLNIQLSDTVMNRWRLTGGFHNQPLQNIIEAIEVNFDVKASSIKDTIVISIKK